MGDFKEGDIIKGIDPSKYRYTNTDMYKGEIVRVNKYTYDMEIKILNHKYSSNIGRVYDANNSKEYFALVEEKSNKAKFKTGDLLVGKSDYEEYKLCEVISEDHGDNTIKIKILEHEDDYYIGDTEWVENTTLFFDLVEEDIEITDEKEKFEVLDLVQGIGICDCIKKAVVLSLKSDNKFVLKIIESTNEHKVGKVEKYVIHEKYFIKLQSYDGFEIGDIITCVDNHTPFHVTNHYMIKGKIASISSIGSCAITVLEHEDKSRIDQTFYNITLKPEWFKVIKREEKLDPFKKEEKQVEPEDLESVLGVKEMSKPTYYNPIGVANLGEVLKATPCSSSEIAKLEVPEYTPCDVYGVKKTEPVKENKELKIKINEKKEEKKVMEFNMSAKTMGLGNIGIDKSGMFKLSFMGLAIKNSQEEWVVYDAEDMVMVNVHDMIIETKDMVMKVPAPTVEEGDLIIHQGQPAYVVEVVSGTRIKVLNPMTDKEETIAPQKSMMGFRFFVKVVSMFNMMGLQGDKSNPMSMMMPLMFMNGGDMFGGDSKDGEDGFGGIFKMMMFSQMMGGGVATGANPFSAMFGGFAQPQQVVAPKPTSKKGGKKITAVTETSATEATTATEE